MIKLTGKYTDAIIYASIVDDGTLEQTKALINQPFMKASKVRIMPDCHVGKGVSIGTTLTITDKIVPNLVGVDIGCGILCVKLKDTYINLEKLDTFIHEHIPAGQLAHSRITNKYVDLKKLKCFSALKKLDHIEKSIGTLGGGNHFVEIDKCEDGEYYLVIHSGSRNLGHQVASYYQDKAVLYHENKVFNKEEERIRVIKTYKEMGRSREIEGELRRIGNLKIDIDIPRDLCYLEGKDFDDYMHDMRIAQHYASENRLEMARIILSFLNKTLNDFEYFQSVHNYINMEDMILRKGAIAAYIDEEVIIPINMRDGCILAFGKGNKDYNFSAPHGAGRIISRREAFKTFNLRDFEYAMKDIYSTTVSEDTLDEAPFAYKPLNAILEDINDTVEVVKIIKPVYSFKSKE